MTLSFAPLSDEQAAEFFPRSEAEYAADMVRAGALDPARARARAARDFADLALDGTLTYLAAFAEVGGRRTWVGVIGWGLRGFDAPEEEPTLYVYDLEVFEPFRRRGYGEALLAHAARCAQEAGAHAVRLTVWGGNDSASALYRKAGFEEEQRRMRLRLPSR